MAYAIRDILQNKSVEIRSSVRCPDREGLVQVQHGKIWFRIINIGYEQSSALVSNGTIRVRSTICVLKTEYSHYGIWGLQMVHTK